MPDLLRFGPPDPPATDELARDAFEQGQAALAAGNAADALRWLDRANRLLPVDATVTLALASACVGQDNARAAAAFAKVAECHPVREAWLGLAGTRRSLGDRAGAAAALATALSCFAVVRRLDPLADAIAQESGAAGWCGLAGGQLVVHLVDASTTAELFCEAPEGAQDADMPAKAGGHTSPPEHFGAWSPAFARVMTSGVLRKKSGVLAGPSVQTGPGGQTAERVHRLPRGALISRYLAVLSGGQHLLGSPIRLAEIRRTEGFVAACDGGLRGWAWHPGDPDADVVLTVCPVSGGKAMGVAANDLTIVAANTGFTRARGFHLPAAALAVLPGPLRVLGPDGCDLFGSPLDPRWEARIASAAAQTLAHRFPAGRTLGRIPTPPDTIAIPADIVGSGPPARTRRRPPVEVVIPVHGAPAATLACVDSVLAVIKPPSRVVVVDDASPEPELIAALDALVRRRRIRLIRHEAPLGFPAAANAGLLACHGRDAVLLNSDTLVAPGWLERLRQAAYAAPDIGTATPLSNSASILSYPGPAEANPMSDIADTARLTMLAHKANAGSLVDIPVAVGFCMYIRRDCLDSVGLFRTDLFAQGYGEENDFCLRARHLGWRHVAAPGVFVAHAGGRSFGPAGRALQARNRAVLNRLHPGYDRLIAEWTAKDPLTEPRRRFDLVRWRGARRRGQRAAILITHADGGGVERRITESCRNHCDAGRRPIVLRPDRTGGAQPAVIVGDGQSGLYPNLRYVLPDEMAALLRLLRAEAPDHIELHHVLGHSPAIYDLVVKLGLPYDVHVHDYVWLCPRVILIGPTRRYCGEPEAAICESCVADAGSALNEEIPVAALRQRSARLLADARRVLAPSDDAAARLRRHFPGVIVTVVPHEDDVGLIQAVRLPPAPSHERSRSRCKICVIGSIGVAKGFDVLLDCARDAALRDLPLEFVVVGYTIDDRRLLATGRVFVTGAFRPEEATTLIQAQCADLALLPSIWPETWCYALSDAWRAGLRVAAFDIGAPAARIRRTGRGFLLPLGLSASAINNALLAALSLSGHEWER